MKQIFLPTETKAGHGALVDLEQLPGGGRGVHALVVVIVDYVAHEVICRGGEHPGLEPAPRGVTCHATTTRAYLCATSLT